MTVAEFVEDIGLGLLAILAIPVAILVLGTPVALIVRLFIELARRLAG